MGRRRKVEQELLDHQDHLEELVESRTAELKRSNQDLEQFARFASHDLQEPVRMMASFSELLARRYAGKLDERADHFIEHITGGANRIKGMLDGLLEYARLTAADQPAASVDLASVLNQARDNLGLLIQETGARLTSDELPEVPGQESQLLLLMQNLLGNAIKFRGEAETEVHVSARRQDGEWVLSVRDNGIGIEPRYQQRIFNLFARVDRDGYPGEGVGLALCQRIVELHGGSIRVESEPGAGAEFLFTLPAG